MVSKQSVTGSQQDDKPNHHDIITARQWVELSRLLAERARSGFSGREVATVNEFINYVKSDVEAVQQ